MKLEIEITEDEIRSAVELEKKLRAQLAAALKDASKISGACVR